MTPATTSLHGTTATKPSGMEATTDAATKATRCASPVHAVTANTGPVRSRQKVAAAEIAPNASTSSRTANTPASDNSQFSDHHARQTNPARGKNRKNANQGEGLASGEANPARMAAPASPKIAAAATATRRKLSLSNAGNGLLVLGTSPARSRRK